MTGLAMTVAQLRDALDIAEDDDRVMVNVGSSTLRGAVSVGIGIGVVTIRAGGR